MSRGRQALGKWGEDQAAVFLESQGYQIIGRNIRTQYGELDLVARVGTLTVFVEVKTRSNRAFGFPEEAVTDRKRIHLQAAAEAYLLSQPDLDREWRIDVISVERRSGQENPRITHFIDAVY